MRRGVEAVEEAQLAEGGIVEDGLRGPQLLQPVPRVVDWARRVGERAAEEGRRERRREEGVLHPLLELHARRLRGELAEERDAAADGGEAEVEPRRRCATATPRRRRTSGTSRRPPRPTTPPRGRRRQQLQAAELGECGDLQLDGALERQSDTHSAYCFSSARAPPSSTGTPPTRGAVGARLVPPPAARRGGRARVDVAGAGDAAAHRRRRTRRTTSTRRTSLRLLDEQQRMTRGARRQVVEGKRERLLPLPLTPSADCAARRGHSSRRTARPGRRRRVDAPRLEPRERPVHSVAIEPRPPSEPSPPAPPPAAMLRACSLRAKASAPPREAPSRSRPRSSSSASAARTSSFQTAGGIGSHRLLAASVSIHFRIDRKPPYTRWRRRRLAFVEGRAARSSAAASPARRRAPTAQRRGRTHRAHPTPSPPPRPPTRRPRRAARGFSSAAGARRRRRRRAAPAAGAAHAARSLRLRAPRPLVRLRARGAARLAPRVHRAQHRGDPAPAAAFVFGGRRIVGGRGVAPALDEALGERRDAVALVHRLQHALEHLADRGAGGGDCLPMSICSHTAVASSSWRGWPPKASSCVRAAAPSRGAAEGRGRRRRRSRPTAAPRRPPPWRLERRVRGEELLEGARRQRRRSPRRPIVSVPPRIGGGGGELGGEGGDVGLA